MSLAFASTLTPLAEQQFLAALRDDTGPRLADPDEHAVFLAALDATEPCS